jgi:gliding motility-associated-like protein
MADNTAPILSLPVINDTVACELALPSAPSNPDRYDVWINSIRVGLATNASDNCGTVNITDNGDAPYLETCNTRIVTFNLADQCGNATPYVATYTTLDTVAPLLLNLPAQDTLRISCSTPIPDPPMVTVQDNCTPNLVASFQELSSQILGACTEFNYDIFRTWSVTDSCGNTSEHEQVIKVSDQTPPSFTVPPNITISCTSDPTDLTVTGSYSNLMDNCDPNAEIQYNDQVLPGICVDEMTINRLWLATDVCGNLTVKIQIINVADLQPPSFAAPPNITVDCSEADDIAITGFPTNVLDNCDPDPDVNFTDDIFPGSCPNTYLIRRSWKVTDRCGQFTETIQEITVEDQEDPQFVQAPENQLLLCEAIDNPEFLFAEWINNRANALASDNCTLEGDIVWEIYNSGTTDAPSLEAPACPVTDQIILRQLVDFIITDECGRSDTMTASFEVLDQLPPVLSECPADFTMSNSTGDCSAVVSLVPPVIEDACSLDMATETASATATLTSQAAPGQEGEVAVDPVDLLLNISTPLPITAVNAGVLTINLVSVDGESADEYFNVYGEDGTLLGITSPTSTPCGNGSTNFTLSVAQLNAWVVDGVISLRLEPNLPVGQPERFAINANCPNPSVVEANLVFEVNLQPIAAYQYSIDNGARVTVSPVRTVDVVLDQGSHLIRYFATDCAGNIDSCSYNVMITDDESPALMCPAPIVVAVAPDSCQTTLTLPAPTGVMDNCEVYESYQRTLPDSPAAALLNFFLDPNLNDYLPQGRTLVFDDVAANAFNDVSLLIDLQGDFNTNGAFVSILGDDGSTLGVTTLGIADCNTPGQLPITIPAATFNSWATDGTVNIQIVPNDITVPPGVLGDGINPCDPMAVNGNGDTDGITFITASLRYDMLETRYYATGVSPLPQALLPSPEGRITATFNVGETEVFYFTQDLAGNPDTCSFTVTVEDVTPPTVLCQPTQLFINPSGLQVEVINAEDVDAGSFDNCGVIDSLWLTPNVFDCSLFGQGLINVVLSARDESGNIGTCQTSVAIAPLGPQPTANSGLCGGDTLYLFANPPAPNPGVYTYQWFDPQNIALSPPGSNPNLIIPSINADDEGPYRVVITGLTGCTSEGVVNVAIEDLPLTPTLQLAASVCADENILLSTPFIPAGSGVAFYWYKGIAPNGTLVGTTTQPMLSIPGPHTPGVHNYYMQVEANACLSPSSAMQTITVFNRPTAVVTFTDTLVCASEVITLGAAPQSGATYSWTGPNGFSANVQFPNTVPLSTSDAGYYFLTVNRGLCASTRDSVLVTVKPRPSQPDLGSNAPVCAQEALILQTSFNGASTYRWIRPNGNSTVTTMPSLTIPSASGAEQGLWQLQVTTNGCSSPLSSQLGVIVHPKPNASAGALPNPACEGGEVVLNGFSTVAGSSYSWSGPANYVSGVQTPTINNITPSRAGTYNLTVTTGPGCQDSTSVDVSVFESVAITGLSDNVPACIDAGFDAVITSATVPIDDGSYTYEWRFNGEVISILPNLEINNVTSANDGTYTLEVFTANGCSSGMSAITLDLNFIPNQPTQPVTVSGGTSFCAGESFTLITSAAAGADVQYFWQTPAGSIVTTENSLLVEDANLGDGGSYRVNVIRGGCAGSVSPPRVITINPIPNISLTSNSPVCSGDVISLQSTFYPNGNYGWSGPSGFGDGVEVFNPIVNNANPTLNSGVYQVFVSVLGCQSDTISTVVLVRDRPAEPIINHDDPICLADPDAVLTLSVDTATAVSGATYTWYTSNGNTLVAGPGEALQVELIDFSLYAEGGLFPFYAQAELAGCTSTLSNPTLVQFDTIPINTAFAGIDTTVCSGEFMLEGATPTVGTGMWSLVSATDPAGFALANPDDANSIVSGLSSEGAPYTLRWTLSNGACFSYSSDEVKLNVINAEVADAGDNILVCEDEVVILGATPASEDAIGFWKQDSTQEVLGVGIVEPSDPSTEILDLEPDNVYFFTWCVQSVCGNTEETIFVNVSDPNINAGDDIVVCDDLNEVELQGEPPAMGSTISWYSPDPDLIISENASATPMVSNLKVGENILIVEVDEGFCGEASRDTMSVFYKLPPELTDDVVSVGFGETSNVLPFLNDQIPSGTTISIAVAPSKGMATIVDEETIEYTAPANFVGIEQLTYLAISEGCVVAMATVDFIVGQGAACQVPSIFTPNGDNYNDFFVIPCLLDKAAYPNSKVLIFNRWGDEVFRSGTPYASDWNGTYSGEDLPADTYFYIVDPGDGSDPFTGYVMIQR